VGKRAAPIFFVIKDWIKLNQKPQTQMITEPILLLKATWKFVFYELNELYEPFLLSKKF
jgi:hypothetical protein